MKDAFDAILQPAQATYLDHLEQAKLQLTRGPRALPTMRIDPSVKELFDFRFLEVLGHRHREGDCHARIVGLRRT